MAEEKTPGAKDMHRDLSRHPHEALWYMTKYVSKPEYQGRGLVHAHLVIEAEAVKKPEAKKPEDSKKTTKKRSRLDSPLLRRRRGRGCCVGSLSYFLGSFVEEVLSRENAPPVKEMGSCAVFRVLC